MKINYIGLSSFLIENDQGYRILIDPFNDAPEWSLGISFPKTWDDKPFGTNLVLMSEPDSDHAYAPGGWLDNAPETKPNSNPFPDLNVRGTVIYEWNGDLNIAWQYTVDGIRLLHLADNAHLLTTEQLQEIGHPDIVFISPPKPKVEDGIDEDLEFVRLNIEALAPKMVIWAHYIVPPNLPDTENIDTRRAFFRQFFKENAYMSKGYTGEDSFMELGYVLENAEVLNKEYNGISLNETSLTVNLEEIQQITDAPKAILFKKMIAKPKIG